MSCYCGIDGINFIGHGEWSDPEIEFNGYLFNYWDVEDAIWDWFAEENYDGNRIEAEKSIDKNPTEYEEWVANSDADIYDMLNDWIYFNCFHNIDDDYMICETDDFVIYEIDDKFFLKDLTTTYFDSMKELELVAQMDSNDLDKECISKSDFDFSCKNWFGDYVYFWGWK